MAGPFTVRRWDDEHFLEHRHSGGGRGLSGIRSRLDFIAVPSAFRIARYADFVRTSMDKATFFFILSLLSIAALVILGLFK